MHKTTAKKKKKKTHKDQSCYDVKIGNRREGTLILVSGQILGLPLW
jgi:hypothetical protein